MSTINKSLYSSGEENTRKMKSLLKNNQYCIVFRLFDMKISFNFVDCATDVDANEMQPVKHHRSVEPKIRHNNEMAILLFSLC